MIRVLGVADMVDYDQIQRRRTRFILRVAEGKDVHEISCDEAYSIVRKEERFNLEYSFRHQVHCLLSRAHRQCWLNRPFRGQRGHGWCSWRIPAQLYLRLTSPTLAQILEVTLNKIFRGEGGRVPHGLARIVPDD